MNSSMRMPPTSVRAPRQLRAPARERESDLFLTSKYPIVDRLALRKKVSLLEEFRIE